ncbi:protein-disulfide reductase DsbD [Methylomagnum sp.]
MSTPRPLAPPAPKRPALFLRLFLWLPVLCWLHAVPALALDNGDFLPVEEAFRGTAKIEGNAVLFHWDIADGYYLYRQKFKFKSQTPGVELGQAEFPKGEIKHDEYFGDMEVFHKAVDARLPLTRKDAAVETVALEVSVQGCADKGLCYPPYKRTLPLKWPADPAQTQPRTPAAPAANLGEALKALGAQSAVQADELLPPDEAFRFLAEVKDAHTLHVSWRVAEGYYLYREKFKFALSAGNGVALGQFEIPHGESKHDEEFGAVEVYHRDIGFDLPLTRADAQAATLGLQVGYQGCADRGVCYPPIQKTVSLELPAGDGAASASAAPAGECEIGPPTGFVEPAPVSEQCEVVAGLQRDSIWLTLTSFLGMGLLLAFTPCIFPMIPILSGIVVGHGHAITTRRAFLLSLSYVVASALAYAVFGVLAGLFGGNLQAMFQEPRIIVAFSALFVVLALSMFGLFTLQMPSFIQSRITALSNRQHGGTLVGAAVMGVLSALIVGPCVAAPLAGALIYIGQTGDAILGGLALFALGLGMGLPLLAIGASAGKLLPKAGLWMNTVKAGFGVGLLGIAVWLLERVLPPAATMFLWALLLIIPAIYLSALDALPPHASGWRKLWKGVGVAMLAYGVLLLIGVASNGTDPLQPLRGLYAATTPSGTPVGKTEFRKVKSLLELDREIAAAEAAGRWVMLDFYANWCVSCKEMERYTFADAKVREALRGVVLLQADVTANAELDQALMRHFGLVGPPATLFFGPDREERKAFRVVGYMDAEAFLAHLGKVMAM